MKSNILKLFLSVSSIVFFQLGYAISNDSIKSQRVYSAGLVLHHGQLLAVYPNYPFSKQVFAVEGEWNIHTKGDKTWHQLYGFPEIGASFFYTNFGNRKVLGYSLGMFPHIKFSTKISNAFSLKYKFGVGLAFLNKPYNAITNPDNFVIGGYHANIVNAELALQYKLNKEIALIAGGSFLHFSNGHTQVPNVGANATNLLFGAKYFLTSNDKTTTSRTLDRPLNKIHLGLSLGFGMQEFEGGEFPKGGPRYPVYLGSIYLSSRLNRKSKLSTGLDINYFTAYHDFIITNHLFNKHERLRSFSVVYYIAHEFLIGHLAILTQAGINIYNPFNIHTKVNNTVHREKPNLYSSNKFGFRYYFTPLNLTTLKSSTYIGLNIKSHMGVADFPEFNVGYLF